MTAERLTSRECLKNNFHQIFSTQKSNGSLLASRHGTFLFRWTISTNTHSGTNSRNWSRDRRWWRRFPAAEMLPLLLFGVYCLRARTSILSIHDLNIRSRTSLSSIAYHAQLGTGLAPKLRQSYGMGVRSASFKCNDYPCSFLFLFFTVVSI